MFGVLNRALFGPAGHQIPKFKKDTFLDWMGFINPGMLAPSNVDLIAYAIEHMPDAGSVVEIGSFAGLSLNHILHLLKTACRKHQVFSVDAWNFEGAGQYLPGSQIPFADYRAHVVETFSRNVRLFNSDRLPFHITLDSNSFFERWSVNQATEDFWGRRIDLGGAISFAYIDGDHSYEQSKRDFENVDKFLMVGGFVVFDDSGDNSEWGSRLTAQKAAAKPDYKLVAKNPNYCIVKCE